MKIAVLGSNGMAGSMITSYLKKNNYNVTTLARNNSDINIDVEDIYKVKEILDKLEGYDFVINCIGLLVKDSIERPDRAIIVNSWFPKTLEKVFKNSNTRIIHLSTDCVFDGKDGYYKENDVHTEMNAYGKSKSLGEINNIKDITFRMSIIGPEIKINGTGLFSWVINNPEQRIGGYVDSWWNGLTTLQLAKCIMQYVQDPKISGVYHLVNNDFFVNKYNLVCLINEVYELNKTVFKTTGPKVANKILVNTKTSVNFNIPDYKTQLYELKNYS